MDINNNGICLYRLPVGMMLIGRHFEDDIVLRAGDAFEKSGIYK